MTFRWIRSGQLAFGRAVPLMLALLAALAGCPGGPIDIAPSYNLVFPAGKRWVTLQQGESNPLLQRGNVGWYQKPLAFDKLDIDGKPVAVYLSRLSADTRSKVEEDMRRAAAVFSEKLREEGEGITFLDAPRPGCFIVEPTVLSWDAGEFGLFIAKSARMVMVVSIFDAQGRRLEAAGFQTQFDPGIVTGWRMKTAAENLAEFLAEYLSKRVNP